MKESTLEKFESAYQEAYELAKRGNPVVQTMIARARFESQIATVSDDEAYRLAVEAARSGFAPAILIEGLFHHLLHKDGDDSGCHGWVAKAAANGCVEARCLRAFANFAEYRIDWEDLLDALNDAELDRYILGAVMMVVDRALQELEASRSHASALAEHSHAMDRKVASLKDAGLHRKRSDRARIHKIECEKKSLMKTMAALSASSLATERDTLRSELEATRRRLADAERDAGDARRDLDGRIAEAIREARRQAEEARLDRDIMAEGRDEARRHAEKAERKTKIMEGLLRKHGLDLAEVFNNAETAACAEV